MGSPREKDTMYSAGKCDSLFVNLDLSPADQEADFLARKANNERKKQEQD